MGEREDKGAICLSLVHFPGVGDLICVWRSAAVSVTSFPARPQPVKIRGLVVSFNKQKVPAIPQLIPVHSTDVFLSEVFLGLSRERI